MNKILKYVIICFLLVLNHSSIAGESLFGISNQTLGYLTLPYASSGEARSYELAHPDSMQLNFRNYATWSNIANTLFSFKVGYGGALSNTEEKKSYNDNANFRGGMLAFPLIKKQLVFGISLLPMTSVKQRITDTFTDENDYKIIRSLIIKGGLSRAMGGFAYVPIEKVSLFAGYEFTFGTINENLLQELSKNTTSSININYDYRYTGNGVVLSTYTQLMKKLGVGLVYRPGITLNCERVGETASIRLNDKIKSEVSLPAEFNLGMEYILNNRYNTGIDFIIQDWENGYKIDGVKADYQALFYQIGFGIERKPSTRLFVNLAEQIAYRAGFIHGQLPYTRKGETVKINALSFGFSLPIQRFRSGIDLSMLVGKRGNLSKNGLEENFISINVTISASEIWFKNIDDR